MMKKSRPVKLGNEGPCLWVAVALQSGAAMAGDDDFLRALR